MTSRTATSLEDPTGRARVRLVDPKTVLGSAPDADAGLGDLADEARTRIQRIARSLRGGA